MAELKNPALAGDFLFDTVVYASDGSNYGTVRALVQYKVYDRLILPTSRRGSTCRRSRISGRYPGPSRTRACLSTDTSASLAGADPFR